VPSEWPALRSEGWSYSRDGSPDSAAVTTHTSSAESSCLVPRSWCPPVGCCDARVTMPKRCESPRTLEVHLSWLETVGLLVCDEGCGQLSCEGEGRRLLRIVCRIFAAVATTGARTTRFPDAPVPRADLDLVSGLHARHNGDGPQLVGGGSGCQPT
jgi:hypothetical protein